MGGVGSFRETLDRLLGSHLAAKLDDPFITELSTVDGSRSVWIDELGKGKGPSYESLSPEKVEMLLNTVASATGQELGSERPLLSAELPEGLGRLQGFLPPVSEAPAFILRKPTPAIPTFEDLLQNYFFTEEVADRLREALRSRESILVVGGTGTGKTTFLNALLLELSSVCPEDRIAVLEDTPELSCASSNRIRLATTPEISLYSLLDAVLRASPDRIIVGEVRDQAALPMLDAWNTGHPGGLATLHANSCQAALVRIGTLIQRAGVPPQNALIAETVSLIVRLEGSNARRRQVSEVARVVDYDRNEGRFVLEPLFARHSSSELTPTPNKTEGSAA